jgi:hypothetical protein
MVVSGFEMPAVYVQLCEAIQRGEAPSWWEPKEKEEYDAAGWPWSGQDLVFDRDPEEMKSITEMHRKDFPEERCFQDTSEIEDTGVENFVYFAHSGGGMSYFFDFGADPKEPSVISFREGQWAREAPDFTSFMARFVPLDLSPVGRDTLRSWALKSVLNPHEMVPVALELLPTVYANLSPEERREVETEVWEELERQGMTDEQRRLLDGLWERLRTSLAS